MIKGDGNAMKANHLIITIDLSEIPDVKMTPAFVSVILRRIQHQILFPMDHTFQWMPFSISYSENIHSEYPDNVTLFRARPDKYCFPSNSRVMHRSRIPYYKNVDLELTAKIIKIRIHQSGISVRELSKILGLKARTSVYHWLQGGSLPSVEHLYRLHIFLNCHMEELLSHAG